MEREYTLGLYEKSMPSDLSWEQKMLSAKAAGFDYIEISIDETDAKLARLDNVKRRTSGTGSIDDGNRRTNPLHVSERAQEISTWKQ